MFFTQKNPCRGGARQGINGSIFGTVKPKRKARAIYTIRKQIAQIEAKRYLRRLTEVVSSGDGIRLPLHIYFTIFLVNVNNFLTEFTVFLKNNPFTLGVRHSEKGCYIYHLTLQREE